MSGIIGSLTAGRIALALGTVTAGAVIGGAVADHRDGDVGRGALIGGASALAGIALLFGGHAAWTHLRSGRAAAASGASQLGSALTRAVSVPAPAAPIASSSMIAATAGTAAAATTVHAGLPSGSAAVRDAVARMFREAGTAVALQAPRTSVPAFAATPAIPAAASGSTFLSTMARFLT